MTRVDACLFIIGLALFFYGLWSMWPAAAQIAGGLFLVASAMSREGAKG